MNTQRFPYALAAFLGVVVLTVPGSLASAHAGLEIKNVSMQLKETRPPVGNKEIHIYDILVSVYNDDTSPSDMISVVFRDPEPGLNSTMRLAPLNATFAPGETKVFTFTDWPTTLTGTISINFSFGPSSHKENQTQKNTGFFLYTLTIPTAKATSSTPGFEFLAFFAALAVFLAWRKMKK
ncbi:MAG TPA: hypothetical protein VMT57_05105 [Candidatus Thermoplasmatota archaeon]|nr:hypothetical protein [Candidatus Thermoplasmatota archaeon]